MQRSRLFSYAWHVDEDEPDVTVIRIYGINEENENVCLRINNFTPYVYVELPNDIPWDESLASKVSAKIDFFMGEKKPLVKCLIYRYKLYYANLDKDGNRKKFPYLFCSFSHSSDIKILSYKLRKPLVVSGLNPLYLKLHEHNASPILQFVSQRKVPTAGWIEFVGKKIDKSSQKTLCDHEYVVEWKNTKSVKLDIVAKPLIMGFDIEVNSSNPARMPSAEKPHDKVFQISCILSRQGDPPEKYDKYLLTLGEPNLDKLEDIGVITFDTEEELLVGFTDFVNKHNPNVLVGYNIMGFDIPYMIDRAKRNFGAGFGEFDKMGFLKDAHAKERTISWSSSAYKNQTFQFLDAEGRLFVDLLPLIKRDYKFNNYKLKTVASFFLKGFTKDDLDPQGIFKCYRLGMKGGKKGADALSICGRYCVKDSLLMNMLFDNLQTWIGLAEMATVTCVPMFYLYTQGQQIKVFSQLYKKCTHEGITVEKDGYVPKEDDHYTGAMVFPPVPGIYDSVVPFDFSSLYPSTIIAYNLDYSTLVEDESIPDSMCYLMQWEDHVFCEHDPKIKRKTHLTLYITEKQKEIKKLRDSKKGKKEEALEDIKREIERKIKELKPYTEERSELNKSKPKYPMCCKRKFRWLKEPLGVLPSLLKDLLDARAHTKQEMKDIETCLENPKLSKEEKTRLETLLVVLDKRQTAYKLSANSGYGITGVQRGMLPMMPIAMSTTAMGRKNITIVAETIPKKYKGQLVYGDTDSCYVTFPHLVNAPAQELWDYAEYVAKEVSKLFPKPMALLFEKTIYKRFLILTKKRYMSLACGKDGKVDRKIKKKGVLLARRDNSEFVRDLYSQVILKIFDKENRDDILYFILQEFNKLCSGVIPLSKFIVTQAIGDSGGMQLTPFIDAKGRRKGKIGDYTVSILPEEGEKREQQLKLKKATTAHEYYLRSLPAQVQLAEKMKRRGQPVEAGTRLEYVVVEGLGHTAKKYEKIESAEYFEKHSDVLKIDYLWYLKQLTNPLDQVLNVLYNKDEPDEVKRFQKNFVLEQYKFRSKQRAKLMDELHSIFQPKIIFT